MKEILIFLSLFSFQGYLQYMVAPLEQPVVGITLSAIFLMVAFLLWRKRPLEGKFSNLRFAQVLYTICIGGMILAMIRTDRMVSSLGDFALVPANISVLTVCLLEPVVHCHKKE